MTSRNWAMLLHISSLLTYAFPIIGIAAPIVIWQLKKDEYPELDAHGKMVLNFLISMLIYFAISGALVCFWVGMILVPIFSVIGVVFPIVGAIKANDGILWDYPLTFKFIK